VDPGPLSIFPSVSVSLTATGGSTGFADDESDQLALFCDDVSECETAAVWEWAEDGKKS